MKILFESKNLDIVWFQLDEGDDFFEWDDDIKMLSIGPLTLYFWFLQ
jgi:hypothetical protein